MKKETRITIEEYLSLSESKQASPKILDKMSTDDLKILTSDPRLSQSIFDCIDVVLLVRETDDLCNEIESDMQEITQDIKKLEKEVSRNMVPQNVNHRMPSTSYPALAFVSYVIRLFSVLIFAGGCFLAIYILSKQYPWTYAVAALAVSFVFATVIFAFSEIIELFTHIANTTTEILYELKKK